MQSRTTDYQSIDPFALIHAIWPKKYRWNYQICSQGLAVL